MIVQAISKKSGAIMYQGDNLEAAYEMYGHSCRYVINENKDNGLSESKGK